MQWKCAKGIDYFLIPDTITIQNGGMKMQLPKIEQEQEPKGKRSIRQNVWSNYIGYIGRYRWMTFASEFDAKEWVDRYQPSDKNGE